MLLGSRLLMVTTARHNESKKKFLFSKNNQTALGVEISGFIFCFFLFVCLVFLSCFFFVNLCLV